MNLIDTAVDGMVTCGGVVRISTLMTDEGHGPAINESVARMTMTGVGPRAPHRLLAMRYAVEDEAPARG